MPLHLLREPPHTVTQRIIWNTLHFSYFQSHSFVLLIHDHYLVLFPGVLGDIFAAVWCQRRSSDSTWFTACECKPGGGSVNVCMYVRAEKQLSMWVTDGALKTETPLGLCFISVSGLILRVIRLKSVPCSVLSSVRKATVLQASSERDFPILTKNKSNTIHHYTEMINKQNNALFGKPRYKPYVSAVLHCTWSSSSSVCLIAQIGTNEPCLWSLGSGLYCCCGPAHFTIVSILLTTVSPQMFRHSSTVFTEVAVSPLKRTTTFLYPPTQFQEVQVNCLIFSILKYQSL